jgi:hypothetical protein
MRFRSPPTAGQWSHVDPILRLLPPQPTLWLAPLFGGVLTIAWLVLGWPRWRAFWTSALTGLAGAIVVGGAAALWLKLKGHHLPPGIRLEESAQQGACLTMTAGYLEEMIVRSGVLPLVYLRMTDRSKWLAVAVSSIITGLAFAALHEPGSPDWSPMLFLARFVVPGLVMSVLALVTKPAFVVVGHCTAHVLIPLLFFL